MQVPDPPSNLQATVLSPTTVQLTWDGPKVNSSTSPVTGYKLFFYDTGDASGIAETEATVATTTYTLNNLKKFHQYSFRVVAYNSNGQGTSTDEVICRTFSDGTLRLQIVILLSFISLLCYVFRYSREQRQFK